MATNNIKPFATGKDANILTDVELASRSELQTGFVPKSKADSALIGKLIQNATAGSSALGDYIATKTQQDVSASDTDLATKLESAITAHIQAEAPRQDLSEYATKSEVTQGLAGKAPVKHSHVVTDVTDLQNKLDSKLDVSAAFTKSTADGLYLSKTAKAESAKAADSAIKATQDASGNVITTTYATKTELGKKLDASAAFTQATADGLYLGKTAKANSAVSADSATKATQDSKGNVIDTTYATKTEVGGKLNTSTYNADKPTFALKTELTPLMPKAGGAFTGAITVQAPSENMHPATKKYVDDKFASVPVPKIKRW